MRLIDADKLEVTGEIVPDGYEIGSYIAGQLSILKIVDELPTVSPGAWISVNDRLPEPFTLVLCAMAWSGYAVMSFENGRFFHQGSFTPIGDGAVTHWMPLPELPKEEGAP